VTPDEFDAHEIARETATAELRMVFRSDRVSTLYRELALVLDHGTPAEAAAAVVCHLAVLLQTLPDDAVAFAFEVLLEGRDTARGREAFLTFCTIARLDVALAGDERRTH